MIFVEPIKRKLASDVISGFKIIFKRAGKIPWKLVTDSGKEFVAGSVQSFFKKRQIQHFCEYTSPNWHAGMAERANRTVRERLYKYFTESGHRRWVPIIQQLVDAINNSHNRSLGGKFTPNDVHFNRKNAVKFVYENIKHQREKINDEIKKREIKDPSVNELKAGTRVRIENRKNIFQKGYVGNFSTEIYTIDHRRHTLPTTYRLRDGNGQLIKGWFYRHDLSPVFGNQGNRHWVIERILDTKIEQTNEGMKKKLALVKWKGFDEQYNTWLPIEYIKSK
jgi:hypothetical protein